MMRVLMADPQNDYIRDLCHLSARTLWESPLLDERGFHCSRIGGRTCQIRKNQTRAAEQSGSGDIETMG